MSTRSAMWRLLPARPGRHAAVRWALWASILAAITAGMVAVRPRLGQGHVALAYLLVVLGGSAAGGRALGLTLAGAAFFAFNYLFLPPYATLVIANPLDWIVLLAFLVTSVVATQLLERARAEAEAARQRAVEIDRLAALGAETLNAGGAEEALRAITRVIQAHLGVARCAVYHRDAESGQLALAAAAGAETGGSERAAADGVVASVAERGRVAVERLDGTVRVADQPAQAADALGGTLLDSVADAEALLIPLLVRDRTVGVLRISDGAGIELRADQRRFLGALAYYAALGVERVRLVAAAERAEAYRQADQLKNALLAAVSHDLRTPLTTIKVLAHELMSAAAADGRDGGRAARAIESEADRLNLLVADLLDLSRLQGGALPLAIALNTADDVVGAVLQRVAGVLHDRRLRVSLEPPGAIHVGRFDFTHAQRILVNLLENAEKYSPPGSPIDFEVRRAGDELRFSVADRGPGIPEPERERVFEPFYRPPGTPADVRGAGLGLAIASRLAAEQGGALRYASRPGGGSVFTLAVPAVDVDPP